MGSTLTITEAAPAQERTRNWILTQSGRQFWLTDPRAEDVDPEDIVHALSNIGRFTGHASRFYSVAEHTLNVADKVWRKFVPWALLHDAAEAYVGDVSSPLKRSVGMEGYAVIEERILAAIFERFGLHQGGDRVWMPPEVKLADKRMLITERNSLLGAIGIEWQDETEPYESGGMNPTYKDSAAYILRQRFAEYGLL